MWMVIRTSWRNLFGFMLTCILMFGTSACLNLPDPADHPGFKIKDVKKGKGDPVGAMDTVFVKYTGKFRDGTVFERAKNPKEYSMFSRTLIAGFKMGLAGMRRGGKRVVTIPPELAFGEKGKLGKIPPNATLIFEIELLRIE